MHAAIFLVALLLPNYIFGHPLSDSTTESLLVVNKDAPLADEPAKPEPRPPQLKSMHVVSNVRNRYGRSVITSIYANPDNSSQEATFSVVLPDTAFITGFVMEIKGKEYEAYVKEKEEAKKEYDQAIQQGLGAAHVAVGARDSNTFTISVNVEPLSKVTFKLNYEELLVRKHSKYEMVINLNPGQLIKDLKVDVNINETRPILHVDTPALRSGNEITDGTSKNEYATIEKVPGDDHLVRVHFAPSVEQQKQMIKSLKAEKEEQGVAGQFVVEYDVERDPQGGEVLVNDGYFVHFFAPTELKPIPKHVVFILDVSGSMYGRKIEQMKQAMNVILGELNENDFFNLVKFHTDVQVLNEENEWQEVKIPGESELPKGISATKDNIKNVQEVVSRMADEGLTNIIDALVVGLRLTHKGLSHLKLEDNKHKPQPMIVFLTDGQANVGESRSDKMIEIVQTRNAGDNKAAIFTIAFGEDANKDFLKELGIKNSGFLRNIYEASDAALQLQDFYKQISSPLLTDIHFKYSDDKVQDVTKKDFSILFGGSEFVVTGKIQKSDEPFVRVEGHTVDGNSVFHPHIIPIVSKKETKEEYGSLERLWAYMTIKQLLDKKYEATEGSANKTEGDTAEKQALKLALKYSFVTPVTSLVVVKPNDTDSKAVNAEKGLNIPELLPYPQPSGLNGGVNLLSLPAAAFGAPGNAYHLSARPMVLPGIHGTPMVQSSFFETDADLDYDSLAGPYTTTFRPPTFGTTVSYMNEIEELPWLSQLYTGHGEITIDNEKFIVGNNATTVEHKSCQVTSLNLSGNCTLLTQCPRIYPKLDSLVKYNDYFCLLEDGTPNTSKYAGVCCIDSDEETHT